MNDFQQGTISYFSSSANRLKSFRAAQMYLEYIFDLSLTASDKMELHKETELMIGESIKVAHPANYQIPEQVAAARFLMINYPTLDSALIARAIVSRHPILRLNKDIRNLRN